jgi:hypothetical protein
MWSMYSYQLISDGRGCVGHCHDGANCGVDVVRDVQNMPLVVGNKNQGLDETDWGDHGGLHCVKVGHPYNC